MRLTRPTLASCTADHYAFSVPGHLQLFWLWECGALMCVLCCFSVCVVLQGVHPALQPLRIVRSTSPCLLVCGEVRPLFFIEELVSVRWFITTFVKAVSIFFLSSFNNTLILQLTKSNLFPEGRGIVIMSTFNWSNCRLW